MLVKVDRRVGGGRKKVIYKSNALLKVPASWCTQNIVKLFLTTKLSPKKISFKALKAPNKTRASDGEKKAFRKLNNYDRTAVITQKVN